MTDRPILFSAPMVRAKRAGLKTMTRRIVQWRDVDPGLNLGFTGLRVVRHGTNWVLESDSRTSSEWRCNPTPCPYGVPGDILLTREAWCASSAHDDLPPREIPVGDAIAYLADGEPRILMGRYRHARFMCRWMCRDRDEITEVRVERLQDISEADCWAEGIPMSPDVNPIHEYAELWEQINGAGSWDANPFVWVLTFRRIGS